MNGIRYLVPLLLLCASGLHAGGHGGDELYMPRDIRRAYENGTRSITGVPGEKYWQNEADYSIRVRIEPRTRLLSGEETISYRNNSPDTLRRLVLKLHQNMNRPTAARGSAIGERAVTEGMLLGELLLDGTAISLDDADAARVDGGNLVLTPPAPMPPGGSAEIALTWEFTIPVATGEGGGNPRMGMYENGSMFLAYWYPKMAVYDDVHGWDMHSYEGEHEFYNDYGDMSVTVDVPEQYGVWATGTLQNPADVLSEAVLARYRTAQASDTVVQIIGRAEADARSAFIGTDGRARWIYGADDVPDFAFGIARGYQWDAVTAATGERRVFVDAVYDPLAETFRTVAEEGRITVEMLSRDFPAVPFPYPSITVFNGYYGMEFPMIVNDGEFPTRRTNVYVHAHEITHSYFPFMVGINETRYAWMDESMAYFLPIDIQKRLSNYDHLIRAARSYERFAGIELDYPLAIPATAADGMHLQMLAYIKPAVALAVLRDVMGEEKFTEALREFIRRWEGKHPLPWDFFHTFNHVNGESLNWFWNPWFFDFGWPDLAITSVDREGGLSTITVRKEGHMPVPVRMRITLEGGRTKDIEQSAAVWKEGGEQVQFRLDHEVPIHSIRLGADWVPDSDPSDNEWTP